MDIVELFGVLTQSGTQPNWSLELLTILADFGTSRLARRLVKLGPTVLSGHVTSASVEIMFVSRLTSKWVTHVTFTSWMPETSTRMNPSSKCQSLTKDPRLPPCSGVVLMNTFLLVTTTVTWSNGTSR